ncbi:uncharacterized protein [Clytia hemisphaerica]|uniref:WSC domain-containing protein n=1 Tax=Clytia hemisphaerica TaxID=252671 RepID=A0A7M5XPC0_9CNID
MLFLQLSCILLLLSSTLDVGLAKDVVKRSALSVTVEGCFNSLPGSGVHTNMGEHASNIRCQDFCRDKGYMLAATRGGICWCRNIYPRGKQVADDKCRTRCRTYTACTTAQECCGGVGTFTVSVVGNIDVAKQVVRRIANIWQTSGDYRRHMIGNVRKPSVATENANWWKSFDHKGWSSCPNGLYMTGLYRNNNRKGDKDQIFLLEEAECKSAASHLYSGGANDRDCYKLNIWDIWNRKNWAVCKNGYYMHGIYRTSGNHLHNIEEFMCCKPKSQVSQWKHCYNKNVWKSFDHKGWSKCNNGYYMSGMFRNSCNNLYCIEEFRCCSMGPNNGKSFAENPKISVRIRGTDGKLKECSMDAIDRSASTSSYKCKSITDTTNGMYLEAREFKVEDKTQPTVAAPQQVKNFKPVICTASNKAYTCNKRVTSTITTSSTLKIGSGFSMGVTIGTKVGLEASAFGVKASTEFSTQISASSTFNVERSKTHVQSMADQTHVTVDVPANEGVMINLLRKKVDIVYKWKGIFQMLGKYKLSWNNGDSTFQDVTSILTGTNREIYAFGKWNYPDTDVLQVIVTNQNSGAKKLACQHNSGSGDSNCATAFTKSTK